MARASAPAKLILCGEHAVVYGRPAIAVPLGDIRAQATVAPGAAGGGLRIVAADIDKVWSAAETPDYPLVALAEATLARLGLPAGDLEVTLASAIPIASGMGSGAAVATALVRALAAHVGQELPADEVSELVYGSEQRFHGTPSGIDNTVVAYGRPIWYVRAPAPPAGPRPAPAITPIAIGAPLNLVIGDTGVRSPTYRPVGAVRERWQAAPARYERLFDGVAAVSAEVRAALAAGDVAALGPLLDRNQRLLTQIGVSSPELNRLVKVARQAGALGAKLSGAGWGGVMLALVTEATRAPVAEALRRAGAAQVLATSVAATVV